MNREASRRLGLLGLALVFALVGFWLAPRREEVPAIVAPVVRTERAEPTARAAPSRGARTEAEPGAVAAAWPLPADKAERIEKIKRDYDEVRAKVTAEYGAAGNNFPGGLNGFLKHLALLEREKRKDFAGILTPPELEELELRETNAGQTVQRVLGDSAATEEQRRAVFRLEREFQDRFALTFDLSPAALFEREKARGEVVQQVRAAAGDEVCVDWLKGTDPAFAPMAAMVARQSLPTAASLELWRVKAEYTERRLAFSAANAKADPPTRAAQAALLRETEVRLIGLVGAGIYQLERNTAFQWLPQR